MDDPNYSTHPLSDKGLSSSQPESSSMLDLFAPQSNEQANPTITHPNASESSSSFPLFPPQAHQSTLSQQERGLMEDITGITLDPDDPAAWVWSLNDASPSQKDATSHFLHSRSPSVSATTNNTTRAVTQHLPPPVPAPNPQPVASVSPSPFAPPIRSTSHHQAAKQQPEREIVPPRDKARLSAHSDSGLGDDPATSEYVIGHASVSRENDSQADPTRQSNPGSDSEMRDHDDRDQGPSQSQPPPARANRRSSSSISLEPSRRMSKTPLFLPSPNPSTANSPSEPHSPQRGRANWNSDPLDIISVTSSSNSPAPPPPRRPRRSPRKTKNRGKQVRQLMAYVLVPPLPHGAHKSDYVPVKQLRTRERTAKGKARAGDNSGSKDLMRTLQGAFDNNWDSTVAPSWGPKKKKKTTKKPAKETLVVLDDEDDEEHERKKSKKPTTSLDQALAAAFTHNSANPNVTALASSSAPVPAEIIRGTRWSGQETRDETSGDSPSVEDVVSSSSKRIRKPPRPADWNVDHPRESLRRKGKRPLHTPTTSPRRKRQRMARGGDSSDEREKVDDSDDEVEIIVDVPRELRRAPKTKPRRRAASPVIASISIHTTASASTPSTPPHQPSSPVTTPNVNSLAGLPLTILPPPARTEITIPPRALSYLHASPGPPDPGAGGSVEVQQMQQHAIRQGFCYEEAAAGAYGLLATTLSAAAEPTPATDSGVCATTTTVSAPAAAHEPGLQHAGLDLHLDLDVSMDLGDGPADTDTGGLDDIIEPPPLPHPLLRTAAHDHPDGPMLGFPIPEHDGAGVNLGHALPSPDRDLDLDFDLTSLSASAASGDGWVDWHAGHVLGRTSAGTDTAVGGEYAGDGTIDPSVLGGGGHSPDKFEEHASSSTHQFGRYGGGVGLRATHEGERMDDEEEEDVMGLLFENVSHDDFVPPSGLGKGKGKGKIVDGVVESPESISPAAAAGARTRRKSWRKTLADETGVKDRIRHDNENDSDSESDEDGPRTHPVSAPVLPSTNQIKRRTPSSSSSKLVRELTYCHHCRCKTYRPKMLCTLINKSTNERCSKGFCVNCIEKRYPDLTFDRSAETFACPVCRNYCNCTICARKRGEEYVSERAGGWRSWLAQQGPSYRAAIAAAAAASTLTSKKKSKNKGRNLGTTPAAKQRAKTTTTTTRVDTQAFDGSWSATAVFTVSGEPLGSAILQGNTAHIVPVPQATDPPPVSSTSTSLIPQPAPEQQPPQKRRYVFIGKPLKAWGPLVSLPDPQPDQPDQNKTTKGKGKTTAKARAGRKDKRIRFFVGSLEPLLAARKRRKYNKRRGRSPLSAHCDPNAGDDGLEDEHPDEGGDVDVDADADADDDGVWPGEYMPVIPTIVVTEPSAEPEMAVARFTPEEVERAIGAAFAIGTAV